MESELIVKLGAKFKDIDYRRIFGIGLVMVPIFLWDVFFWVVEKLYDTCLVIDNVMGRKLKRFMEK